ncbi:MAG: hypothetical protein IIC79_00135 [Chloroflexi bacterium]|nr:hypothetical protein [Chloroflexota bacterium]
MVKNIPGKLNPYTRKKFEAINSYDPYDDVISDLNQAFHYSYNQLIHETHERLGKKGFPVIIMFGEKVMLFHDGEEETIEVIPQLYHRIKSISHVSFGVFITLASNGYGKLKDAVKIDLEHAKELIESALEILAEEPIPEEHMNTQRATLENAITLIRDVLDSGKVTEERVREFGKENAPLYMDNAAIGAKLELDLLHETVMRWREEMGKDVWESVYVVICAGHQARYRELSRQYFQKLLHELDGLGANVEDRVIYAEHIHDVEAALDLLARHINDQEASNTFFGDKMRLQQDLMSESAAEYLNELLPK